MAGGIASREILDMSLGGRGMRNSLAIFVIPFCVFPGLSQVSSSVHIPQKNTVLADERRVEAETRARANALAAGDCQGWGIYVDANFRVIEGEGVGDRAAIIKGCEFSRTIPGYKQKRIVSDFHFQRVGNLVIADYQYDTIEHFGDVVITETIRQVCTFRKGRDGWVALVAVNIPIAHDPPAEKVVDKQLDVFTGRYAWVGAPKIIDLVTRNSDRLFLQGTGDTKPTELVPLTADTFFVHGSFGDHVSFFRDASDNAIGYEVRGPDGQGYRATRDNDDHHPYIGPNPLEENPGENR
jgi:hypothetical protein